MVGALKTALYRGRAKLEQPADPAAPEAIADLCRELGLPYRTSGYRFW
jgi:hypothetical protein